MLRRLLTACTLAMFAAACGVATDDLEEGADAIVADAPWHDESDVADASEYAKVLAYFDANAERGSFVSDRPKVRDTRQGSEVDIAYAVVRAKRERGAVVVVNGRTESFSHYAELVYDLSRRGYSLYLLDHRGQGHSSRLVDYDAVGDDDYQKGHVDDFQDYVDDLAKFVDTVVLPDRVGKAGKLFAIGHSMGGAVATLYAEQYPDTFAAVALSSPMHEIAASSIELGAARGLALFASTAYALGKGPRDDAEPFEGNELTGSRARFYAKRAIWNADATTKVGGPTYGWIARGAKATEQLRRHAGAIESPVLLLEGANDVVVAPRGQHEVCDAINEAHAAAPTPRCELVVLDGSRHEGLIESDPIRRHALDLVAGFFARQ